MAVDDTVGENLQLMFNISRGPSWRLSYWCTQFVISPFGLLVKSGVLYIHLGYPHQLQGIPPCSYKVWSDLRFHLSPYPPSLPFCNMKTHSYDFEMMTSKDSLMFSIWSPQCPSLSLGQPGENFSPPAAFVIFVNGRKFKIIVRPLLMVYNGW